jgi:hypothetical protein
LLSCCFSWSIWWWRRGWSRLIRKDTRSFCLKLMNLAFRCHIYQACHLIIPDCKWKQNYGTISPPSSKNSHIKFKSSRIQKNLRIAK